MKSNEFRKVVMIILILFYIVQISSILSTGDEAKASELNIIHITDDAKDYRYPSFTPDGNNIIYVSNESEDGFYQIWKMDIEGNNHKQLTFDSYNHSWPSINRDGTMLLYKRSNESINIKRGDTDEICIQYTKNNSISVIAKGSDPSFNSDYTKVLFVNSGELINSTDYVEILVIYDIRTGLFEYYPSIYTNTVYIQRPRFSINNTFITYSGNNNPLLSSECVYLFNTSEKDYQRCDADSRYDSIYPQLCLQDDYICYLIQYRDKDWDYLLNSSLYYKRINGEKKHLLIESEDIQFFDYNQDGHKIVFLENGSIKIYYFSDLDQDDIPDIVDDDRDGDGHRNEEDEYPDDPDRWEKDEKDHTWLIITLVLIMAIVIAIICFIFYRKRAHPSEEILDYSKNNKSSMRKRKG